MRTTNNNVHATFEHSEPHALACADTPPRVTLNYNRSLGVCVLIAVCITTVFSSPAKAHFIQDVAFGLGSLGFDIRGDNNPLSGGVNMLITNRFRGEELDFGLAELGFQGPISMQIQTGRRGLPEMEFSFTTAIDNNSFVSPLNYIFNYDVGAQSLAVSGSVELDMDLKINALGFYDLGFAYDFSQNTTAEGLIFNSENTPAFTVDPVNVKGHVLADILVILTAPIFNANGTVNPFAQFSGLAQLNNAAAAARNLALSESEASLRVFNGLNPDPLHTLTDPLFSGSTTSASLQTVPGSIGAVVPEPTVLVLMLLGLPAIFRRSKRRIKI